MWVEVTVGKLGAMPFVTWVAIDDRRFAQWVRAVLDELDLDETPRSFALR